jgi:V/A-type H+-transporting ATPase subunit I
MCFCFILALVQLSMGRLWKAVCMGNIKGYLSNIGWILVLIGNFILILKLLVYPGSFPGFMWYFFIAGLLMVIFSDVDWKDPAAVFQFPFNIINSFTDVLSYIRLFAVGMAGFYIADSFNGMAGDVFRISPWLALASAVILLFGHGLNLALCLMSVMVHGVRLNTLEFSNHVGLCWGGIKFQPFQNKVK